MNKWWYRVPIILFCLCLLLGMLVVSSVAMAAEGMTEFGQLLSAAVDGLEAFFQMLVDMLAIIW